MLGSFGIKEENLPKAFLDHLLQRSENIKGPEDSPSLLSSKANTAALEAGGSGSFRRDDERIKAGLPGHQRLVGGGFDHPSCEIPSQC